MSEDKTSQKLTLSDGRALGFAEYGDAEGKVVVYFNGSGGSRLEHPTDPSILIELGICFVATDRPGHGLSDPKPDRRLLDWPDDIVQLADHLQADTFYVMGLSAGGPHALSCAYKLPERVLAGALASGLAPPERPNPYQGLPFSLKMINAIGRRSHRLVYLFRRLTYPMLMGDPEVAGKRFAASFPPEDRELMEDPLNREMLVASIQEGYRQNWQGPSQDDIIINTPWGFSLEEITVPFHVWSGEVDKNVPFIQAQYQHDHLPNSQLTVLPGQAHLFILAYWQQILSTLVA